MKTSLLTVLLLSTLALLPAAAPAAPETPRDALFAAGLNVVVSTDGNGHYIFTGGIIDILPGSTIVVSGMEEVAGVPITMSLGGRFTFEATIHKPGVVTVDLVIGGKVIASQDVRIDQ